MKMENAIILLMEDNPDDEALTLRALQKNNVALLYTLTFSNK